MTPVDIVRLRRQAFKNADFCEKHGLTLLARAWKKELYDLVSARCA